MANMFRCVLAGGGGGNGADLIVTCDSVFSGTTITCTDGTSTFTETCPSTSPYTVTFESIPTGTWTISGTYDGQTFSTNATITDFEAFLGAIPEGSTATPTDNIQIWLHCANIWDKTYTTISQVLADASTLQALVASNNAADYMARSTTWSTDVTADSSAMSYIGLNNYCSDALLADSTWLTAICDSTYFENVLNVKVPTMTSYTTPSGVVSANAETSTKPAWYAFDGNDSTTWGDNSTAIGSDAYIQYQFTNAIRVNKFRFNINAGSIQRVSDIRILGSNDGVTWTEALNADTSIGTGAESREIYNSNYYLYYRAAFRKATAQDINLETLQFYGRASS